MIKWNNYTFTLKTNVDTYVDERVDFVQEICG